MSSTNHLAAAALLLLSCASSFISPVHAGEMDVGGAGFFNPGSTVNDLEGWKRASSKTYSLSTSWKGSSFKDGWSFFNYADPTNGMVNYLSESDAVSKGLFYTDTDGSTVMKVDNTNWLSSGSYRDSVRITSNTAFNKDELLIIDASHMPYGCSVWPAFWTVGANWPYGGEIDIIEGVNLQSVNQMTLHTAPGCEIKKTSPMAGTILQESCDAFYNSNTGCGIKDPNKKTYGSGFNAIGGGVFATLWDDNGISIWFFARNNIPSDITKNKPKPSGWGKPRAFFGTSDCDMDSFFGSQTIVFDITLCGDWAGSTYNSDGCSGTCASQVMTPTNFDEAYWKVAYVKIFE